MRSNGFLKDISDQEMIYVYFWKSYVYNQYCNNKMKLPQQEFTINYEKLNDYLTNKQASNSQFYQYLHQNNISQLQQLHFSHQLNLKDLKIQKQPISQIFLQSQRQIFGEIINQTKQIVALQKQLADSQKQINYLRANIAEMLDSKVANSQYDHLIEQQKINQIKRQRQDLQRKIQIAKLMSLQNIEEQTRQAKLKTQQIKASMAKLNLQLKRSGKLQTKKQLQNEIGQIHHRISAIKGNNKQWLITCLNQRKVLQQEMIKQDQQKQQFLGLLLKFKAKFKATKDKNRGLKQQLAKKGLSLPAQTNP